MGGADPVIEECVGFARAVRRAGAVHGDAQAFVSALARLDPLDRDHLYWAGRATLCAAASDIPAYDAAFERWISRPGDDPDAEEERIEIAPRRTLAEQEDLLGEDEDSDPLFAASQRELLRKRDFEDLHPAERARLAELFAELDVRIPQRPSRRDEAWRRGEIDVRAMAHDQFRHVGEITRIRYRRPRRKPRRIVLLIDISKSMSPFADHFLRLAHRITIAAPPAVEVFTLGTRLTRITRALRRTDPDDALREAGELIADWSGGTRLADGLAAFIDDRGRGSAARRAAVVVISDGWERGDVAPLAEQTRRLRRLAHELIWVNPQNGRPGYEPVQAGIAAVLPHVDRMLEGNTLATFEQALEVIADV